MRSIDVETIVRVTGESSHEAGKRKLRRSQSITPFGVGAPYSIILGESFVAEDMWVGGRDQSHIIKADRLSQDGWASATSVLPHPNPRARGIDDLYSAHGLPFWRFPRWLFCSSCRRMIRWHVRDEQWGVAPLCIRCDVPKRQLTPMRFIMICGRGHMDDVPWDYWAHSEFDRSESKAVPAATHLRFRVLPGVGEVVSNRWKYLAIPARQLGA